MNINNIIFICVYPLPAIAQARRAWWLPLSYFLFSLSYFCLEVLVIEYWNLNFICNLLARRLFGGVLGICDFRHKTPRQSQISLCVFRVKFFALPPSLPRFRDSSGLGLKERNRLAGAIRQGLAGGD